MLCQAGPGYGYFPLPRKTVLIVKPEHEEIAGRIFHGSGVQITTEGERHMGAAVGSENFKEMYVKKKVEKWVEDGTSFVFVLAVEEGVPSFKRI